MTSGNAPSSLLPSGSVSAAVALAYARTAMSFGAPQEQLEAQSGLSLASLNDEETRIPLAVYVALIRAGKSLSAEPALPLLHASADDFSEVSIAGLIANASETMLHALAQLNRFGQLAIDVPHTGTDRIGFESTDDTAWLVDQRLVPNAFPELTEGTFTRLITGPRRFLPRPHILEAHVTHPEPEHRAAYDEIWQCPVRFNAPRNALRMDPDLVHHRVCLQPKYAFGVLSEHAEKMLQDLQASKSLRGQVEARIMPILHTGEVSSDVIASELGMSRQTLYRQLKNEEITFEEVLDALRHKLALHYLNSRKTTVAETAYLVGFADPSSFSRAFKRWTGQSPAAARR